MKKKSLVFVGIVTILIIGVRCSKTGAEINISNFKALPLAVTSPVDNLQSTEKISLGLTCATNSFQRQKNNYLLVGSTKFYKDLLRMLSPVLAEGK